MAKRFKAAIILKICTFFKISTSVYTNENSIVSLEKCFLLSDWGSHGWGREGDPPLATANHHFPQHSVNISVSVTCRLPVVLMPQVLATGTCRLHQHLCVVVVHLTTKQLQTPVDHPYPLCHACVNALLEMIKMHQLKLTWLKDHSSLLSYMSSV